MMELMEEKLQEYAKLLIEVGLNVQKGQTLIISAPVECAHFARLCAGAAYDVGCREVVMNWHDDALTREKYLRAADEVFDEVPRWREHFFNDYAKEGAAYLSIAADPLPAGRGQGAEGLLPAADEQRLSLVHRIHPHSLLGGEGLSGRGPGDGYGEAVGRHFQDRAHHRRRPVRGALA